MKNNILDAYIKCTGCRLCEHICPKKCISFVNDREGFLVPQINKDICVNCGLCVKRCPQFESTLLNTPIDTYAAYARSDIELSKSTSGGAFYLMAKQMIANGGVVFGSAWNKELKAGHLQASSLEEVKRMRGSKYVQSDTLNTFNEVLAILKNSRHVLYTGTPCQIAGLNRFLETKHVDSSLLITVDIVCHGVPSPYMWRDYIAYLEKKQGSPIVWVNFRDKQKYGWAAHHETFKFKTGGAK